MRKTLEFNDADSIAKNAKYWKPQKKRPKKLYIKKWEKTQAYWWLLFYVLVYSHFIFFFWIWCVCLFVCLFVFFIIKRTNEKKKRTFHRMTAKIKENKGRWKSGTKKLFVSQKRRLCIPFQVCFFFFSLAFFLSPTEKKKKLKRRHTEHRCSTYVHVSDKATAHISLFNSTHTHTHTHKKKRHNNSKMSACNKKKKEKKQGNSIMTTTAWREHRRVCFCTS